MANTRIGRVSIDTGAGILRITDTLPVPIKTAWTLLTSRHHIAKWWGDYVAIELHPGGVFEELWTSFDGHQIRAFGTVREIAAPHLMEVTWREESWDFTTSVHLHMRQVGEHTEISITHRDWPSPVTDSVRSTMARHYHGWKMCLLRLKRYAQNFAPVESTGT